MPQTARVKRALSTLRREYSDGGMSVRECASRIMRLIEELRLVAVAQPSTPTLIWLADLGVACSQVVVPASDAD